jgi:hydrogenase maturation protease
MSSLRVLIVGIGNPWCTDDGFGPAVIEQLDAQADVHDSRCCHRAVHQLMPELAAELTDVDLVVFVDASTDGTSG